MLLLPAFDRAVKVNREQVDYGKGLATSEEKFHYYLDLQNQYIYFYDLINTHQFAMHHWAFLQKGSLGIHQADIDELFSGRTVLSSIYQDDRTELNVMSFLTPVYLNGKLKGIVMVDINKHNLQNIVFTHDRPWSGVISMPASRIPTRIRRLLFIKAKIIFSPTLITSAIFPGSARRAITRYFVFHCHFTETVSVLPVGDRPAPQYGQTAFPPLPQCHPRKYQRCDDGPV